MPSTRMVIPLRFIVTGEGHDMRLRYVEDFMIESESYRLLIEREWADLHHSRVQEWTALGIVAGAHLGLIQLASFAINDKIGVAPQVIVNMSGILGAILSIIGALMTCRHRRLMQVKLGWIYQAELHLGLIKTDENPDGIIPSAAAMQSKIEWRGLSLPRLLSTIGLILCFYVMFFLIDILVIILK